MLRRALAQNGGMLALFALITTSLITLVNYWTAPVIQQQQQQQLLKTLKQVFPAANYDNDLANNCINVIDQDALGSEQPQKAYRAIKQQQPVGMIFEAVAPDGYSGGIHLLVGIKQDNTLQGVRVTQHSETPGLGDKIDLRIDDWILSFNDQSLMDDRPFAVKKDGGDFDQFTGATITPRATVNAVAKVLAYYQENSAELWAKSNECEESQ